MIYKFNVFLLYHNIDYNVGLSAINFAFQASLTVLVHTALHIAFISSVISVTPSGSFVNGSSTKLFDASSVPGSDKSHKGSCEFYSIFFDDCSFSDLYMSVLSNDLYFVVFN